MTPELESKIRKWGQSSEGWTTIDRLLELAELILKNQPACVVELGVFGGRSLIPQALACQHSGIGKVYGVDPWHVTATLEGESALNQNWWKTVDLEGIHRSCMKGIWEHDLQDRCVVVRSESQNCASLFTGGIEFITIDGNHSEVSSVRDVNLYLPLVRPGGIIIMDDTDWIVDGVNSTKKAVAIVHEVCELLKDTGHYRIYRKL